MQYNVGNAFSKPITKAIIFMRSKPMEDLVIAEMNKFGVVKEVVLSIQKKY